MAQNTVGVDPATIQQFFTQVSDAVSEAETTEPNEAFVPAAAIIILLAHLYFDGLWTSEPLQNAAVVDGPPNVGSSAGGDPAPTSGAAKTFPNRVFTPEQQDPIEMAKGDKAAGGISKEDMEAYKKLNAEAGKKGFTQEGDVRGPETHPVRTPQSRPGPGQTPHGHVGPVDHIPIKVP